MPKMRLLASAPLPEQGAQHLLHGNACYRGKACNKYMLSMLTGEPSPAREQHLAGQRCAPGLCCQACQAHYPTVTIVATQLEGPGTLRIASEPAHCLWPCPEGEAPRCDS